MRFFSCLLRRSTDEGNLIFAHTSSLLNNGVTENKLHPCVFSQFSILNFCVGALV